jgi:H+/Cl- antiporter ClcA
MKQFGNVILILLGVVITIFGLLYALSVYATKDYKEVPNVFWVLAAGLTFLIVGVIFYKKLQKQIRDDKINTIRKGNNKKNKFN